MEYEAMGHLVCGTRWRDLLEIRRHAKKLETKYGIDTKVKLVKIGRMPKVSITLLGHMDGVQVAMTELRGMDPRAEGNKPPLQTFTYPLER